MQGMFGRERKHTSIASISYSSNTGVRVRRAGASKKLNTPGEDVFDDDPEEGCAFRECSILSRKDWNDALTSEGAEG